uniref:Homeobox protein 2-like n=1 Tax=Parastrongyloides trichosuri TaxID=131310 RepID=A0A0N4ZZ52_PARTI
MPLKRINRSRSVTLSSNPSSPLPSYLLYNEPINFNVSPLYPENMRRHYNNKESYKQKMKDNHEGSNIYCLEHSTPQQYCYCNYGNNKNSQVPMSHPKYYHQNNNINRKEIKFHSTKQLNRYTSSPTKEVQKLSPSSSKRFNSPKLSFINSNKYELYNKIISNNKLNQHEIMNEIPYFNNYSTKLNRFYDKICGNLLIPNLMLKNNPFINNEKIENKKQYHNNLISRNPSINLLENGSKDMTCNKNINGKENFYELKEEESPLLLTSSSSSPKMYRRSVSCNNIYQTINDNINKIDQNTKSKPIIYNDEKGIKVKDIDRMTINENYFLSTNINDYDNHLYGKDIHIYKTKTKN